MPKETLNRDLLYRTSVGLSDFGFELNIFIETTNKQQVRTLFKPDVRLIANNLILTLYFTVIHEWNAI